MPLVIRVRDAAAARSELGMEWSGHDTAVQKAKSH